MTAKQQHLMMYAGIAGAGFLAWKERDKIAAFISPPVAVTPDGTAALPAPVTSQAPIIMVSPPTPTLTAADIGQAVSTALATPGYTVPGAPLNSTTQPVQTPFGTVYPSVFTHPAAGSDLPHTVTSTPTPTHTPTPTPTHTPTPTPKPTPVQNLPPPKPLYWPDYTFENFKSQLQKYSNNYYDYNNALHGAPNYKAASIPAYKKNMDDAKVWLDAAIRYNPTFISQAKASHVVTTPYTS